MRTNKILKITSIILVVMILILISFVGIYSKENGRYENQVIDFLIGKDFGEERVTVFKVGTATRTTYYDIEGKVVDGADVDTEAPEGTYTTEDTPINAEEVLTTENYITSKEIMNERIQDMGISDYTISVDESSGQITLKALETDALNDMLYAVYGQGEFLIVDADTNEVLLDNEQVKSAQITYYTESYGTTTYLLIDFKEEGTKTLETISSVYVEKTDEEGNDETKQIRLKIDGETILETYFAEPILDGKIQIAMSSATTDVEAIQASLLQASQYATKINYGKTPVFYEVEQNVTVLNNESININAILQIGVILITIISIAMVIRLKERGIIATLLFLGYIAIMGLVIRYGNVYITISSIIAGLISILIYLVFIIRTMYKLEKRGEENPKGIVALIQRKTIVRLIPLIIIAVVFAMFTNMGVNSFGLTLFWGITVFILYSYLIVKPLIINIEYLMED